MKFQANKIKYRFLYYLANICQIQPIKTTTLAYNFNKSQSHYIQLCAKTALESLKAQFYQKKQNITRIQQMRKAVTLSASFKQFIHAKAFQSNCFMLSNTIRKSKIKKFIDVLRLNFDIQRQLDRDNNVSFDFHLSIQCNKSILQQNLSTSQTIKDPKQNNDLFKYLEFIRLKEKLSERFEFLKKQCCFIKLRKLKQDKNQMESKFFSAKMMRSMSIFSALNKNHQRKKNRITRNTSLAKIYNKKLIKTMLNAMKNYKFIRLSHEQALESIEHTIINPKQLLTGFNRIYERNCKIFACQVILGQVNKFITRTVFRKCFYSHIQTLQKVKQMAKQAELKKLDVLFTLLQKNQEFNESKIQEIKQNAISKLNKVLFIRNLKSNCEHAQKYCDLFCFNLEQRQLRLINSLKERKQKISEYRENFEKVEKMLGFSLLRKKIIKSAESSSRMEIKYEELTKYLRQSEFDLFVKSLNTVKNSNMELESKFVEVQTKNLKGKFNELIHKIRYEKNHKKSLIESKVQKIYKSINFKSFLDKFQFEAKSSYLTRWTDWKQKESVFEKMDANKQFKQNIVKVENTLNKCKQSFAWNTIKQNLEIQRQVIEVKTNQLGEFLGRGRKRDIKTVSHKVKSIRQTQQNTAYLTKALKLKYLSKFMRNSLIIKYQKVKQFCAIKSYARNLKSKTLDGFRMMLMRLRDKENRLKTEQEIILKVDKAMYNSRKSNKLSETIQRFNSMKRSLTIGGSR